MDRGRRRMLSVIVTCAALTVSVARTADPDPPAPSGGTAAPAAGAPLPGADAGAASTDAGSSAARDTRPLVRLVIRNDFRPDDRLFPQLVEGRLVADLADMETFRTAGHDAPDADYVLTCVIHDISYDASTIYKTSRDADASSAPQPIDQVSLSMAVKYTLVDVQGKTILEGKFSADASREFEISSEHTAGLLKEEMIDRAAQRLERLVRKRLKRK